MMDEVQVYQEDPQMRVAGKYSRLEIDAAARRAQAKRAARMPIPRILARIEERIEDCDRSQAVIRQQQQVAREAGDWERAGALSERWHAAGRVADELERLKYWIRMEVI